MVIRLENVSFPKRRPEIAFLVRHVGIVRFHLRFHIAFAGLVISVRRRFASNLNLNWMLSRARQEDATRMALLRLGVERAALPESVCYHADCKLFYAASQVSP